MVAVGAGEIAPERGEQRKREGGVPRLGKEPLLDLADLVAVVQDQEHWARYQGEWLPGLRTYDRRFFDRLLKHPPFSRDADAEPFLGPTLILAGRQDHISGYRDAWDVLESYPRATYAVLDRAGHRVQMEQETLFNALVNEWLDRVEEAIGD